MVTTVRKMSNVMKGLVNNNGKTIMITGATDGLGLATATVLARLGHNLIIHGRNADKLAIVSAQLTEQAQQTEHGICISIHSYIADLSRLEEVKALADNILAKHQQLDVLINNAGVFKIPSPLTVDGLDARFVVNTFAPYLLTQQLASLLGSSGRVINLSSAAQAPVNIAALQGKQALSDMEAYAQSKLAITMWTRTLSQTMVNAPLMIAVNPGSLLASKMVKEGFGVAGKDISIGADVLVRFATQEFAKDSSGLYFDNDSGRFSELHPAGLDESNTSALNSAMTALLKTYL